MKPWDVLNLEVTELIGELLGFVRRQFTRIEKVHFTFPNLSKGSTEQASSNILPISKTETLSGASDDITLVSTDINHDDISATKRQKTTDDSPV